MKIGTVIEASSVTNIGGN